MPSFSFKHLSPRRRRGLTLKALFNFLEGTLGGGTFTRASTAAYHTSASNIAMAAIDAARFDYHPTSLALLGLWLEPTATNLLLRSSTLDRANWAKVAGTVGLDVAVGPDGASTADTFIPDATNAAHNFYQLVSAGVNGNTITFSYYVKAAGLSWFRLSLEDGFQHHGAFFNAATGAVGTLVGTGITTTVEDVGDGWRRFSITKAWAVASAYPFFAAANADNSLVFAGNASDALAVWGAQLEVGTQPSSIQQTTSAQLTRAADVLTLTAPAGTTLVRRTFSDGSVVDAAQAPGAYVAPIPATPLRLRSVAFY